MNKVEIANYALSKLGEEPMLLLTDDNKKARLLNRIFDQVRDAELRRCRWKFSIARTQLSALVAAPAWGYARQFPLPSDFLQLVQANDIYVRPLSKARAPWSLEQGMILTDLAAPLKVRYVQRVTNPGLFDPLFNEVLACKLAMEAAETLTQSSSKKAEAVDQYKFALAEAKRQDAIENPPDELPGGSWLAAREGGFAGGAADGNVADVASAMVVL